MNVNAYLKEKFYLIMLAIIVSSITILFLKALNINQDVIIVLQTLFWIMILCILIIEYVRRASYYKTLSKILEHLDQKYLVTELISEPTFIDGQVLYETLHMVDKSMNDHVNMYKALQKDYKTYIELWVHEIKTPLAAAKLVNTNNPGPITESLQEEIEKIERYVEQALFYARSSYVEKDYVIKEFALAPVVSKIIRKHSKTFILRKIKLELTDLDCHVYSDTKWLEFILDQIIVNALKYTNEGVGSIHIYTQQKAHMTLLHINDNGIGILEKDIKRIFERSFTGENGRESEKATGMGLYLCKMLCDKLNLSIEAKSAKQSGTTITIGFPISEMMLMK